MGTVILPVQVPLIIAYALSYTVIYANGANLFYKVLGFFPPTAPVAMPVLYAAGDVPAWQAAISAVLSRWARCGWRAPRRPSTGGRSCAPAPGSGCGRCSPAAKPPELKYASAA